MFSTATSKVKTATGIDRLQHVRQSTQVEFRATMSIIYMIDNHSRLIIKWEVTDVQLTVRVELTTRHPKEQTIWINVHSKLIVH